MYLIYFYVYFQLIISNFFGDYVVSGVLQSNPRGEMFASISSSLLEKFRFDSSFSADSSFQVRLTLLFNVSFQCFQKFYSFHVTDIHNNLIHIIISKKGALFNTTLMFILTKKLKALLTLRKFLNLSAI